LKHTLFIANDNDFTGTVTDSLHPSGIDNPNQFFVFAIDARDLPTYLGIRKPWIELPQAGREEVGTLAVSIGVRILCH
jgi:hypothetical protein